MNDFNKDFFKTDAFYDHFKMVWQQADIILEDSSSIRGKGEDYLYRNASEKSGDYQYIREYKDRLNNAYLPHGYKRELTGAVGKVFDNKNAFKISTDNTNLPDNILDYILHNIDMNNNGISRFARDSLYMAIHKGCSSALVEYSKEYGRAFVNLIDPLWIINYKEIDHKLVDIRILDSVEDDSGDINEISRRYYINEQGYAFVEKYKKYKDKRTGKEIIELMGEPIPLLNPLGKNIGIIPIYDAYGGSDSYKVRFRSYPLMQALIENTIRLYNMESNLDALLGFIARTFPIPYVYKTPDISSGIIDSMGGESSKSTINDLAQRIGTRQFVNTQPGEDLRILEFNPQQVEPIERRVKELKDERAQMGLTSLLTRTPGRIAATVKTIEQVEVNSVLQEVVIGQTDFWYGVLNLIAIREGIADGFQGSVTINHDFGQIGQDWAISTENLKIMQSDASSGLLSPETYIRAKAAMGAYGPYSDEIDLDAEIAKIDLFSGSIEEVS